MSSEKFDSESDSKRIAADILIALIGERGDKKPSIHTIGETDQLTAAAGKIASAYQTIFDAVANASKQK